MTAYEKQTYLETTTDKGNKRYVTCLHIPCAGVGFGTNECVCAYLDSISDLPIEKTSLEAR